MRKLSFKKEDAKISYGLSGTLKVLAAATLLTGAMACTEPSDDCRTTTTDTGNAADLGAQQDPNTFCDGD
jgi:hypothetical protein